MKMKNILFGFLIIFIIPMTYFSIEPFKNDIIPLQKSSYTLKTYDIKGNLAARFMTFEHGRFQIEPGVSKPTKGIFTFNQKTKLTLDFSINFGSKSGDIEFTVQKNKETLKKFIVTIKKKNHVKFHVNIESGDKLTIIADKHGSTDYDWGKLVVEQTESPYIIKNFIIPFSWVMFLIFMVGKNFKYLAINIYLIFILFILAEKTNFSTMNSHTLWAYTTLLFALSFIYVFLYQELKFWKKFKIIPIFSFLSILIIYTFPLSLLIFSLNFGVAIDAGSLYDIFQSNPSESYEYILSFIEKKYIFLYLFTTIIVGLFLFKQAKRETLKIEKSLMIFLIITFSGMTLSQFESLRLPHYVMKKFIKYTKQIENTRKVQLARKTKTISFTAKKQEKNETYLVVIGESLNRGHMGVYGYFRDTTPMLSQLSKRKDIMVFNEVYSNYNKTMATLSYALTEKNQYNSINYNNSLSIFEVLNKANIESYWITAQPLYGPMDNMVTVLAKESSHFITKPSYQDYDGPMIEQVRKALKEPSKKSKIIFVHLYGNHSSYASRYPHQTYNKYKGTPNIGEFGEKVSHNNMINHYDNSVLYNDYVVSALLNEIKKEKGPTGFIYLSDHSEDVLAKKGHSSFAFSFEMLQIPMVAWFNNQYKIKYADKYANFLNNQNTLFTNDLLYDTLIGLLNIKTKHYNALFDLSSDKYKLEDKDALVMHGEKHFLDKDNFYYLQKKNLQYITEYNLSKRILPTSLNSIGELTYAVNMGVKSLTVDIEYSQKMKQLFIVQNSKSTKTNLEKYLSAINVHKLKNIQLHLTNASDANSAGILLRLAELNTIFSIKNKTVLQLKYIMNFFQKEREHKWSLSWIINPKITKDNITTISDFITNKNINSITFKAKNYSLIKKYLEPTINTNVMYNVLNVAPLYHDDFISSLLKNPIYIDNRVQTLSVKYRSPFK